MDIHFHINKKHVYVLVGLFVLLAGLLLVQGYSQDNSGTPETFGHSDNEIDYEINSTSGRVPLGKYIRENLCTKYGKNCPTPTYDEGSCQAPANSVKTCTLATVNWDFCALTGAEGVGPAEKGYIFRDTTFWKLTTERGDWPGIFHWKCFKF